MKCSVAGNCEVNLSQDDFVSWLLGFPRAPPTDGTNSENNTISPNDGSDDY